MLDLWWAEIAVGGHRAAIVPLLDSGRARAVPWAEVAAQARPTALGRAGTGPSITGPGRARAGPNLRALGRANGPRAIWKSIFRAAMAPPLYLDEAKAD